MSISTSQLIGLTGNFKDVPYIPANITLEQAQTLLIPSGFDDLISVESDELSQSLKLEIETEGDNENVIVFISKTFFNPSDNQCLFPKFLIEQSSRYKKIDYFNTDVNRFIFNQNEMLWLVLQHRLVHLKKHKQTFGNLITSDIKSIKDFISYSPSNAHNAKMRDEHTYVVLSVFDEKTNQLKDFKGNQCIGTLIKNRMYTPTPWGLDLLMESLPIHYTPESSGELCKFVLAPYTIDVYRSLGHKLFKDQKGNWFSKSLFPPKQNLASRTKTHISSDACVVANFKANSVWAQDYLPNLETRTYSPKDSCYIETLVVIHPILDNDKFLYGEVEANERVVNTHVIVRETVTGLFDDIYLNIGQTVSADKKGTILVGVNAEDQFEKLENCIEATLINVIVTGALGYQKLIFDVKRKAGNARLDSNNGLKGVTTCKANLGTIKIPSLDFEQKPDLVFGMNSFKAKGNSIESARAALAVKLGLYKPKDPSGFLNSFDVEEIEEASSSLPEFEYYDMFGVRQTVQIGIIYARFTELCYIYKSYEHQSFSFEAGRMLSQIEDCPLFEEIWDNCINLNRKNAVIELQKILLDRNDIFEDELPSYSISQIKARRILKESDLILNKISTVSSISLLLDEEWNKGFFLNLSSIGAGYIRIPSAKMLNLYCSKSDNGTYMFPTLAITISKILKHIFNNRERLLKKTPNQRFNLITKYKSDINGILFSDETGNKMMVQTLSRPEIKGFAMKQTTDYILPPDTCVIFDRKIYDQALYDALGKDGELYELEHGFYGLHVRAPALWRRQLCPLKIWNEDSFRIFLHHKYGIKLEDYINPRLNQDVIIFSGNVLAKSQSDK